MNERLVPRSVICVRGVGAGTGLTDSQAFPGKTLPVYNGKCELTEVRFAKGSPERLPTKEEGKALLGFVVNFFRFGRCVLLSQRHERPADLAILNILQVGNRFLPKDGQRLKLSDFAKLVIDDIESFHRLFIHFGIEGRKLLFCLNQPSGKRKVMLFDPFLD